MKTSLKPFVMTLLMACVLSVQGQISYDFSALNKDNKPIYYRILSDSTVGVANAFVNCYAGKIDIPDTLTHNSTKYKVVSIINYAFALNDSLTEVTVPTSVRTIGKFAFQTCPMLETVTLTDSIETIEKGAFKECYALLTIHIPVKLTHVSQMLFHECKALDNIYVGNAITYVDTSAFESCEGLRNLTIGPSVTSIKSKAFQLCLNLNELILSNSIDTIETYSFYGSSNLRYLQLGNDRQLNLKYLGQYAFSYCTRLLNTRIFCEEPPRIYDNTFIGIEQMHVLHVPCETFTKYDTSDFWTDLNTNGKTIVEDTCVGLYNLEDISFEIYPNPASNMLTIEGENIDHISIYNLLGQEIYSVKTGKSTLNVSQFHKGIYIIGVKFSDGRLQKRRLQIQ